MDISVILFLVLSGLATIVAGSGLIVITRRQSRKRKKKQATRSILGDESARLEREQKDRVWAETLLHRKVETEGRIQSEQEASRFHSEQEALQTEAEEEARLLTEQESARLKANEQARLQVEAALRFKEEEELRIWAENAVRLKVEEQARLQTLMEARIQAEADAARLKAKEDARILAEQEAARLKAEEEARLQADETARQEAETARLKTEEEIARLLAEQEAIRLKSEEQARLQAEAALRFKEEEELRIWAENAVRLKVEEQARLQTLMEARIQAEADAARLKAKEDARILAEQEAARLKAEEEARLQADETARQEAETARLKTEEEIARLLAEQEATRLKSEEQARLQAEAETARLKDEENARLQAKAETTPLSDADDGTDWIRQLEALIQHENSPHQVEKEPVSLKAGEQVGPEAETARLTAGKEADWEEPVGPPYYQVSPEHRGGHPREDGSDTEFQEDTTVVPGEIEPHAIQVFVPFTPTHFKLVGTVLPEDHEGPGTLFVGRPPLIKAENVSDWSAIHKIVVGQEGPGRNRWKTHFSPDLSTAEQSFPPQLTARRGGWYFVRFYDTNDTRVQSMDFRFTDSLKKIVVDPHSPVPGPTGHLPIRVEFTHAKGALIRLVEGKEDDLNIQRSGTKTIVIIPPTPIWDRTRWAVDVGNDVLTEVAVLIRRIWWSIGGEDYAAVQAHLTDRPRVATRRSFSAAARQHLWLRFPMERWADSVLAGFSRQRYRTFRVDASKKRVSVPLEIFSLDRELKDTSHEQALDVWISSGGRELHLPAVVRIPAEKLFSIAPDPLEAEEKRKAAAIAARKLAPRTYNFQDLPTDRKCCSTCSYATINEMGVQCFVGTWEERIDPMTFYYEHGNHCCSRWQGEYRSPSGVILTE